MSGRAKDSHLSDAGGPGLRRPRGTDQTSGAEAAGPGAGLPPSVDKVLVLGASRSGLAAAAALKRRGVGAILVDRKERGSIGGLEEALAAGIEFLTEAQVSSVWPSAELVIKSPGVPGESPVVSTALERGIAVWSEVELAYALLPNPFDAITGTNGKTTTTALLGHLFATAGRPARVLGNIGMAVTSVAGTLGPDEELVVEVSSFQLEDMHSFRPAVGVFLNLTPDHLDRHGTMERYLACKANLFAKQQPDDVAVLNLADEAIAEVGASLLAARGWPAGGLLLLRRRRRSAGGLAGGPPIRMSPKDGCSSSVGAFCRSRRSCYPAFTTWRTAWPPVRRPSRVAWGGTRWPRVCAPSGAWPTGWSRQGWSPG